MHLINSMNQQKPRVLLAINKNHDVKISFSLILYCLHLENHGRNFQKSRPKTHQWTNLFESQPCMPRKMSKSEFSLETVIERSSNVAENLFEKWITKWWFIWLINFFFPFFGYENLTKKWSDHKFSKFFLHIFINFGHIDDFL